MNEEDAASGLALVVERQVLIQWYVCDLLRDAGFTVLTATQADDARATLDMNPEVRVLVCDWGTLGPTDVTTLLHYAAEAHPAVGLVVTAIRSSAELQGLPPKAQVVWVPFEGWRLKAAVQAACSKTFT